MESGAASGPRPWRRKHAGGAAARDQSPRRRPRATSGWPRRAGEPFRRAALHRLILSRDVARRIQPYRDQSRLHVDAGRGALGRESSRAQRTGRVMKLVVFGLTISSSWGNGHATLWRGLCRSLGKLGHQVVFYERDVPYYAGARDFYQLERGELVLYSEWDDIRQRARRDIAESDVAMVTSYCPDAGPATESVLDHSRLSVFYDLDTPITLTRLRRGEAVEYIGPGGLADFD